MDDRGIDMGLDVAAGNIDRLGGVFILPPFRAVLVGVNGRGLPGIKGALELFGLGLAACAAEQVEAVLDEVSGGVGHAVEIEGEDEDLGIPEIVADIVVATQEFGSDA